MHYCSIMYYCTTGQGSVIFRVLKQLRLAVELEYRFALNDLTSRGKRKHNTHRLLNNRDADIENVKIYTFEWNVQCDVFASKCIFHSVCRADKPLYIISSLFRERSERMQHFARRRKLDRVLRKPGGCEFTRKCRRRRCNRIIQDCGSRHDRNCNLTQSAGV